MLDTERPVWKKLTGYTGSTCDLSRREAGGRTRPGWEKGIMSRYVSITMFIGCRPAGGACMLGVAQFIATLSCTIFAGAAIYVSLVEHPARRQCDTRTAAAVWAPSYLRATMIQAPLAGLSCIAGIVVWWLGGLANWLVGALLIGSVGPFSL